MKLPLLQVKRVKYQQFHIAQPNILRNQLCINIQVFLQINYESFAF